MSLNHRQARLFLGVAAAAIAPAFTSPATAQQQSAAAIKDVDIIVTAQRREERAQDVPIVVNVFSAQRLEELDVNEPQDLYGTVPSLVVGTQGNASREAQNFAIRGQATGYQSSPAVIIYMNEVPLPAVGGGLQGGPGLMVDLENVQVLSGPQGTLFGRNTTGGAVLYSPRKPTNAFEGYLEGTAGNYNLWGVEGALNIPVIDDKLMIRAVGAFQDRRGFTKDIVWNKWRDDTHWYSGRLGITLKPFEGVENYLMLYGSKSSNNGTGHIHEGFNIARMQSLGLCFEAPVPGLNFSCGVYQAQSDIAEDIGPRRTRLNADVYSRIKLWGAINTTTIELNDAVTLKNIFSYQRQIVDNAFDQDGTPIQQYGAQQDAALPDFPVPGLIEYGVPSAFFGLNPNQIYQNGGDIVRPDGNRQITEELQLQGNLLDNRLQFTAGAFYFENKNAGRSQTAEVQFCPAAATGLSAICPVRVSEGGTFKERSKAIYAQTTLDLGALAPQMETLRLTTGIRYTWDDIRASVNRAFASNARLRTDAATWTVGLDYHPVDNLMLYGKVSRGYKAGGILDAAVFAEKLTFAPEKLMTYETGFKSDWQLGGMPLRFNATYYFSDYSNIQRPTGDFNPDADPLTPGDQGLPGAQVLGASAHIQGLEIETSIRPAKGVEIGGTVSHTDADYTKFEYLVTGGPGGGPFPGCNGTVLPGQVADLSCRPFQFVTNWIYNIYGSVEIPVPEDAGKLSLYMNYSHVSRQPTSPLHDDSTEPGSILEPFGLLNASLSWRNIGRSGLDATLFVNNLLNKLYRVSNSNVYNDLLVASSLYGEPRMWGLKLRYSFGK